MPSAACNRGAVDPSATATRRTRLSLALTSGGAVVLMAGVSLMLIGEITRLEQPAGGLKQLISLGAVLAAAGLALGLVCVIVVITGPRVPVRSVPPGFGPPGSVRSASGPVQSGPVQPSGSVRSARSADDGLGDAAADAADDWLGPLRDGAIRPVTVGVRDAAAARAGALGPGHAGAPREQAGDDYLDAQYSDEGWRLDGTGPVPAQRPADPSQEIHHPVRPMTAPRPPGQPLGADTGQFAAYRTGQFPAYDSGQFPASESGERPAYDTGQLPAYTGQFPASETGERPAYDTGQLPAYGAGERPVHDSGPLPGHGDEAGSAPARGQHPAS
jgi:hypothetical protein